MISVLLADDHALVRSGFAMVLSSADDINVVGQAANGQEAVDQVSAATVDVVLMDVQMPVMDGIEATRQIVATGETKVIILTTFDRDDYLFQALRAGASGFLLKNADPDDLIDAVHAVADGHALLAPEATLKVIRQLNQSTRVSTAATTDGTVVSEVPAAPQPSLTPSGVRESSGDERQAEDQQRIHMLTQRELQVLECMAKGMSNAEIASEFVVGAATVKTHVSNILAKTGSRDRVQAVVFAYRSGLCTGW